MPLAQRWADNWSCGGIHHFHIPINVCGFEVVWIPWSETLGICGIICCIMHTVLFGNIRDVNKTRFFFSAFDFFLIFFYIFSQVQQPTIM